MAVIHATAQSFEKLISQGTVLADFWAGWCGPCMMLAPTIEAIAEEQDGKLKVGKVNVDEQQNLAARFGIESIPTLLVFKEGKVVNSGLGLMPKEAVLELLK